MAMKPKTRMIHAGITGDNDTGAVTVPIYQTSTYKQNAPGVHRGYEYSRTKNPTRFALEELMKDLENGVAAFAFASGMAAITSVMMLFKPGDHLVMTDDVYGGTFRVMTKVFNNFGIDVTFVDTSDLTLVKNAINERTKAIYIETPTNPLLKITDIAGIAAIAHDHKLLLIVDNTFITPYFQLPLDLGADIVLHSATKYISGHSDVVAGVVVVKSTELAERLHFIQNATGAVLGPQDSYLLIRGIRTLALRMEAHEANARELAEFLNQHPKVEKVYYPGLPDHKGFIIAKRQASGFGGMISFDVRNSDLVGQILSRTHYFTIAESLGAVESLISVPAKMTHASIPKDRREALGITESLIRLSVGVEDIEDLTRDLMHCLSD